MNVQFTRRGGPCTHNARGRGRLTASDEPLLVNNDKIARPATQNTPQNDFYRKGVSSSSIIHDMSLEDDVRNTQNIVFHATWASYFVVEPKHS